MPVNTRMRARPCHLRSHGRHRARGVGRHLWRGARRGRTGPAGHHAARWHGPQAPPIRETFRVVADDADALVVAWLSELLYALDAHGWLSASLRFRSATGFRLSATARGETLDEARHVLGVGVKAVSYHESGGAV